MKLLFFLHSGNTEVGGFGFAPDPKAPLTLGDLIVPKQTCTSATVDFDQEHASELFEDLYAQEVEPIQCQRVWIHTHPGDCPRPSGTDEQTFSERQGDWDVMFILAKGGQTYCRLKITSPFFHEWAIPTRVAWTDWPEQVPEVTTEIFQFWVKEYKERVQPRVWQPYSSNHGYRNWEVEPWRKDLQESKGPVALRMEDKDPYSFYQGD